MRVRDATEQPPTHREAKLEARMTTSTATRLDNESELIPTSTHWGNYLVERRNGRITAVYPYAADPHPSPIGQSLRDAQDADCRVP